jgi:hypothetical protein
LHRWFIPAIRPGSAIDSTHITFSEVFSIFFMQHWGKDREDRHFGCLSPNVAKV